MGYAQILTGGKGRIMDLTKAGTRRIGLTAMALLAVLATLVSCEKRLTLAEYFASPVWDKEEAAFAAMTEKDEAKRAASMAEAAKLFAELKEEAAALKVDKATESLHAEHSEAIAAFAEATALYSKDPYAASVAIDGAMARFEAFLAKAATP